MSNVSPITPGIDEMDPFEEGNLYGAIRDLGIDNKRNRSIKKSLLKSICHVEDMILGNEVLETMPTMADIERIPPPPEALAKGITAILPLNYIISRLTRSLAYLYFYHSSDSKASEMEKTKAPPQKLKGVAGQSS